MAHSSVFDVLAGVYLLFGNSNAAPVEAFVGGYFLVMEALRLGQCQMGRRCALGICVHTSCSLKWVF